MGIGSPEDTPSFCWFHLRLQGHHILSPTPTLLVSMEALRLKEDLDSNWKAGHDAFLGRTCWLDLTIGPQFQLRWSKKSYWIMLTQGDVVHLCSDVFKTSGSREANIRKEDPWHSMKNSMAFHAYFGRTWPIDVAINPELPGWKRRAHACETAWIRLARRSRSVVRSVNEQKANPPLSPGTGSTNDRFSNMIIHWLVVNDG